MKKITNRMISFAFLMCMGLFLFSLRVNAANNVTTINASGDTQGATVSGTTDDDVVAVLIEILDESNRIVTLETHAVTDGAYSATLSCILDEGSTYTAYVVNYDGTGESMKTTFLIPVPVTGVVLNKTSETITTAGGTLQLTATVSPSNATDPAVTWTSSNPSVATVDNTGKVTAVANGTATITVTTTDRNKTATATITVAIRNGDDTGNGSGGSDSGSGSGTGSGSGNGTGSGSGNGTGSGSGSGSSGGSNTGSGSSNGGNGSASNQNDSGSNEIKEEKVNVPIEYIVVRGDVLGKIARKHHLTLQQILSMNPQIKNPNFIRVGQKIVVGYTEKTVTNKDTENNTVANTNPEYYTVQRGDSLYKIARMNRMTLSKLVSLNPDVMTRKYIYAGQKIRIK